MRNVLWRIHAYDCPRECLAAFRALLDPGTSVYIYLPVHPTCSNLLTWHWLSVRRSSEINSYFTSSFFIWLWKHLQYICFTKYGVLLCRSTQCICNYMQLHAGCFDGTFAIQCDASPCFSSPWSSCSRCWAWPNCNIICDVMSHTLYAPWAENWNEL